MSGIKSYVSGMTLILLLTSLLLGGLLYSQWYQYKNTDVSGSVTTPDKALQSKHASDTPIQPFTPMPLSSFSEITERPLFVEGRIPPEPPAEDKPSIVPVAPPQLKLEGVAITSMSRTAVITDLKTSELLRLNEGMSHQDWKVESVGKESVTIKRGAQEIILKLEIEDAAAASTKSKLPFRIQLPLRRPPPAIPNK